MLFDVKGKTLCWRSGGLIQLHEIYHCVHQSFLCITAGSNLYFWIASIPIAVSALSPLYLTPRTIISSSLIIKNNFLACLNRSFFYTSFFRSCLNLIRVDTLFLACSSCGHEAATCHCNVGIGKCWYNRFFFGSEAKAKR